MQSDWAAAGADLASANSRDTTGDETAGKHLLSPEAEARVFWRLRGRMVSNLLEQTRREARLRFAFAAVLSTIFWLGLFWLFLDAFKFLGSILTDPVIRSQTMETIFDVFFLSLLVMLFFSAGVILYSGLYRSAEASFLLTLPVRSGRVFLHKFQETLVFSSWGFILLGTPMLVAYGLAMLAPWYYYVLLLPFLVSFVVIPAALGAMAALAVVRWLPRARLQALIFLGGLCLLIAALLGWSLLRQTGGDLLTAEWFNEILARLGFAQNRLLPSWWLSHGLLEAANYRPADSVLFLTLLISNALFLQMLAVGLATRIYRSGYTLLRSHRSSRTFRGLGWIDRWAMGLTWFLPKTMRLLIVKDLRLFRRDPVQWSQYAIFFGLLGMYFLNIRRFSYPVTYATWVNMVSFLNLAVVGLMLSIFTSRFVFPLISLEGKRFWVLGRLPISRATIVYSKFAFGIIGTLLPAVLLVAMSDWMLAVEPWVMASHLMTCVLLSAGLTGVAVGLGAKLPNLREESPSKIAAGFGGILNQVLSTMYIVAIVLLTAIPCHFVVAAESSGTFRRLLTLDQAERWFSLGTSFSLVLGLICTIVPMALGLKAFKKLEV